MREAAEESVPFRWDLVTPDRLGSLLADTAIPTLWFLDDLVALGRDRGAGGARVP